ncbi:MAG: hypothetical protein U0136_16795 [Bdellovibrionota bacterium]
MELNPIRSSSSLGASPSLTSANRPRPTLPAAVTGILGGPDRAASRLPYSGGPDIAMSGLERFRSVLSYSSTQRQADSEHAKPLLKGAADYSSAVGWLFDRRAAVSGNNSNTLNDSNASNDWITKTRPVQEIGKAGQKYLYAEFQKDLLRALFEDGKVAVSEAAEGTATTAAGQAAGEAAISGTRAYLAQFLGAAGAAYSLYGLASGYGHSTPTVSAAQGVAAGAYIGSVVPGIGTVIGGLVGGAVGGLVGLIHIGKHPDQLSRDRLRGFLQQTGLIDKSFTVGLSDGTRFDIGKDGSYRTANSDGTMRRAYETDFSNPLTAQVVAWVDPLAAALTSGNDKLKTDLAGYLANAALSNASSIGDAKQNVMGFYSQLGIDMEKATRAVDVLKRSNVIPSDIGDAYANSLRTLFVASDLKPEDEG